MSFLREFVLSLLRGYKWVISPMFPPSCRYVPTCSEYAMDAVAHHGVVRGSLMTLRRLLRCHPFAQGGYDPVNITGKSDAPAGCGPAGICIH
jgi:hypothetical protein